MARRRAGVLGGVLLLGLLGCFRPPGPIVSMSATVGEIEIVILESFPVQVHVVIRGDLPDACTRIASVSVRRSGERFDVAIVAERERDAICAQVLTPYEETVALSVHGLAAGTYLVDVHGVTASFVLDVDNLPQGRGYGAP